MAKPLIKVMVDHRCVPHVKVLLRSGKDLSLFVDKVIGTVTVKELISNDDHVMVNFGKAGVHQCSRSEVTFIADLTSE